MILNKNLRKKEARLVQYEVQKIVDDRKEGNRMLYLVKWKGYSHEENTWEPRAHLLNAPEKIREWNKRKLTKGKVELSTEMTARQRKLIKKKRQMPIPFPKHEESGKDAKERQYESLKLERQMGISQQMSNFRKEHSSRQNDNFHEEICQSSITKSHNVINSINCLESNDNMKTRSRSKKNYRESSQVLQYKKKGKKYQTNMEQQLNQKVEKVNQGSNILFAEIKNQEEPLQIIAREDIEVEPSLFEQSKHMIQESISPKMEKQDRFIVLQEQAEQVQFSSISPLNPIIDDPSINHNHFFSQSIQPAPLPLPPLIERQLNYFNLVEIYKMYKHNGVVYCTGVNKKGLQVDKIPYDALQAQRPDIVIDFFNIKYPQG